MDNILTAFPSFAYRKSFFPCRIFPSQRRAGKTDKIPCDINGHNLGAWGDRVNQLFPSDAISHAIALQHRETDINTRYGIGRAFDGTDNDWFVDIDNGLNAEGTGWSEKTLEIVSRFSGAGIELSQSGRGLHIYCKGNLPPVTHNNQAEGIEVHGHKKFAVVTGSSASGNPDLDCTDALRWLIDTYATVSPSDTSASSIMRDWAIACTEPPHALSTPIADDTQLIERMLAAAPAFGDSLRTLWQGTIGSYPSASEATAALASHLAFWTGNDAPRMARLMEESPAASTEMGAKWDREDVLPRAILFARRKQTSFYNSNYGKTQGGQNTAAESPSQPQRATSSLRFLFPEQTHRHKIINSTNNLIFMLRECGITARWNDMKHEREIHIPGFQPHFGDRQNATLCHISDLAGLHEYPISRIDEQLTLIAQQDTYHPIVESMELKPWDRIPRLDAFIACIQTDNPEFARYLIRLWMISTMTAAYSEQGFSQQGILVLQGEQGIQKTRLIKTLDPIGCGAVKEGAILDPTNKDNVIQNARHWIVEIAELDGTLRKTDMARIKSHLTAQEDEVRFPYARKNTVIPRRTSHIATVNDSRFLNDQTGNRRFWTIGVDSINLNHGLDMQQIWAEVRYEILLGADTWMTRDEIKKLSESNEKYEQINPVEERLLEYFDFSEGWNLGKPMVEVTCSKALELLGYKDWNRSLCNITANILKKHGRLSTKRNHYFLPQPKKHS